MKLRRLRNETGICVQIAARGGWVDMAQVVADLRNSSADRALDLLSDDVVSLLGAPPDLRAEIEKAAFGLPAASQDAPHDLLAFEPKSFRDFMLYERHAIDAARGFVSRFMPAAARLMSAYEHVLGPPFPPLKPHRLWSRQPIYYMGNHLAFAGNGEPVTIPSYTQALDYELELGFVLARPLLDATPEEAEAAIGGFVVVNDFSARDVQLEEMRSGFGPQKSKHFRNAMSSVVVSADEILPRWRNLAAFVRINGETVSETTTSGARWSLGEALSHVSRGEQLHPGELFATGTLPGGSGIETGRLLHAGDVVTLGIDGIGILETRIIAQEPPAP